MYTVLNMLLCFCPLLIVFASLKFIVPRFELKYAFWSILLGLAAVIPVAALQFGVLQLPLFKKDTVLNILLTAVLFNGLIEEGVKLLCMLPVPSRRMTLPAFCASAVLFGLSLGCFETAIYFIAGQQNITVRMATAVVIHTACAVLSGMYIWMMRHGRHNAAPFIFAVTLHGIYNFFASFYNWLWWFSVVALLFTVLECRIWYQRAAGFQEE